MFITDLKACKAENYSLREEFISLRTKIKEIKVDFLDEIKNIVKKLEDDLTVDRENENILEIKNIVKKLKIDLTKLDGGL